MYIVEGKIVSSELFTTQFMCNLDKCKGACCWEGDFGAPVTEEEIEAMDSIKDIILPRLSVESRAIIADQGQSKYEQYCSSEVTPLHKDGSCVYLAKDDKGIARCVFEQAWEEGLTDFKKPISCHLYPVRVSENASSKFEALNYDEWEICKAACSLGEEMKMPVFRFAKDALIRNYGEEFYEQLEALYEAYFKAKSE